MSDWLDLTFFQIDDAAFTLVNGWATAAGGFLTPFFAFVSLFGKSGIFFLLLGAVSLLFKKTRRAGLSVLFAVCIGALFTNVVIKCAVGRLRPYQKSAEYFDMWQLVGGYSEKEFSFPSGHATVTTTAVTALFLSLGKKKNLWLFILPVVMGIARIYLIVHYLTDVVGGFVVGAAAGTLAFFAVKGVYKALEKSSDKKFSRFFLDFDLADSLKKNKN